MNWADREYAIGRGVAAIRHKAGVDFDHYLRSAIESGLPALLAGVTGSTFPNVSKSHLEGLLIQVPPPDEQAAISDLLCALDDKIELNRETNHTLEGLTEALFDSWFIDFDPVVAKADGRQPFGMSANTAALFPAGFQDSTVGPIPEGWRVGTLGEIGSNLRRTIKPHTIPTDIPYIGLEHMPKGSIVLANWGKASDVRSAKTEFRIGEILFGKLRPYFRKVGVAPVNGICSTDILVIGPKERIWFGYLLGHLSSTELVGYADATSSGTRQPRTNWEALSRYLVAIPPVQVSAHYSEMIGDLVAKMTLALFESRTLAELRDLLPPLLLSGEIRLAEAEEAVEAVGA
jgi:type I restriction enzyme S subunit